ncbi:MAG TPA: IS4 family transposase [Terracidiphilus sp.]|nr:IS4 family transposase [Terracidiphilus sp.]
MATIAHWARLLKSNTRRCQQLWMDFLSARDVDAACRAEDHRWRQRLWTPLETLWAFLLQVLHPDSSCRQAVAMALGERAAMGLARDASPDPSAYCQARSRLPCGVVGRCLRAVGERLSRKVAPEHVWCGRRIRLVDGSSCSMPDTPELQEAFGQPDGQRAGCGFPVATIVALFCWASGAVLGVAIGAYRDSELRLWRRLWQLLTAGDVVLADRFYCTYADIVGLLSRGCDAVLRLHQRRKVDFRRGKRLGCNDRLVTWSRPTCSARARGMSIRQWQQLPLRLTVRLIRANVCLPGFRCRHLVIATTLLDPVRYPMEKILSLYRDRWIVELRLRDIKTTLGMDIVRGKSPDIVRKEIRMHMLAYNLIRCLMWEAAAEHGRSLHRLSFAGTVQRLAAMLPYLWLYAGTGRARRLYAMLLRWIAHDILPRRPNRIEPRAVKRRPKQYPLLNKPRHEMRKALLS